MTNDELTRGNRPVSFRRELIVRVLGVLMAGESCSLVGVGSSGKSNVARHLARREVLAYHLGEQSAGCLSVLVNCTHLAEYTLVALHTLILDALSRALNDALPQPGEVIAGVVALRDQAIEAASAERARINLQEALVASFRSGFERIFILLDDFDRVVQRAPPPVLNSLRPFRDDHKGKLMYVTFTRRELAYLRDEAEFQELYELVATNSIPVGPYSDDDARAMVRQLSEQWGPSRLSPAMVETLLKWSGNHPGLLRAILTAMRRDPGIRPAAPDDALARLKSHHDVLPECEHIWESLEAEEHAALMTIVRQGTPTNDELKPLIAKGLIEGPSADGYRIRSPLFAAFVKEQLQPRAGRSPFEFDPARNEARINGHTIRDLDPVELGLLRRICERYPQPATRVELLSDMQAGETLSRRYGGSPDARLSQYLMGLKRRLDLIKLDCLRIHADGACRLVL
ncbi:MAG: hypothetical protein K6U78_07800 [Anaerolineae bacterium]|nr:hypothetical protein [Anaerolineae bacterium]